MVNPSITSESIEISQAHNATCWTVLRVDDNGNRFIVADRLTEEAAAKLVAEFTARGHKQVYWAEMK